MCSEHLALDPNYLGSHSYWYTAHLDAILAVLYLLYVEEAAAH